MSFTIDMFFGMAPLLGAAFLITGSVVVFLRYQGRNWRRVRVTDGDSFVLQDPTGREHRVRLVGVDAPEMRQPLGMTAKNAAQALLRGKQLSVTVVGTDRYGRTLAHIQAGSRDLASALVAKGLAYPVEKGTYRLALFRARLLLRGVWRSSPVTGGERPWDFRKKSSFGPIGRLLRRVGFWSQGARK